MTVSFSIYFNWSNDGFQLKPKTVARLFLILHQQKVLC